MVGRPIRSRARCPSSWSRPQAVANPVAADAPCEAAMLVRRAEPGDSSECSNSPAASGLRDGIPVGSVGGCRVMRSPTRSSSPSTIAGPGPSSDSRDAAATRSPTSSETRDEIADALVTWLLEVDANAPITVVRRTGTRCHGPGLLRVERMRRRGSGNATAKPGSGRNLALKSQEAALWGGRGLCHGQPRARNPAGSLDCRRPLRQLRGRCRTRGQVSR